MTVEELSSKCGAIPHRLKPLLDVCVSMGLMVLQNRRYMNSPFSRVYLVEGEPLYVGDLIQLQYDESKQWDTLYDIMIGDKDMVHEPRSEELKHKTFIRAMNNLGMLGEAEALENSVDISGCRQMIDAGGGSGIYSLVFCRMNPELRSTILDKKVTLAVTKEMIADSEERERITLTEADITKATFGENIDAVLLSDVIYDQSEAAAVLRNAWDCLRRNGLLVVRGYYSDPDDSKPLFGALFVLNQLVFDPDRTIMTVSSLQQIIRSTGFTITKLSPLTERSFVITAKKVNKGT